MVFKKFRKMKVYSSGGYNYKNTPSIILKGDWLKESGFDIGGLIQVECENRKLIITQRKGESNCGKDYGIGRHEGGIWLLMDRQ